MVAIHGWQQCRPALLATWDEQTPEEAATTARIGAALDQVWAGLGPYERRAFHELCCLNRRDPEHVAVVERIQAEVERLIGPGPTTPPAAP